MSEFVSGNTEISKRDLSGTVGAVYIGGVTNLQKITNRLDWHTKMAEDIYKEESLTLDEIYEQVKKRFYCRIITVIEESPLSGRIYQCGNYEDGKWVQYGELRGYA